VADACLTTVYLYEHAGGDRRDCQPEPGDGIDDAGRN
jgi:hypothetical protein